MAEKEDSYEDLLDFFDNGKDANSSVDINLNSDGSCLQPSEEENNVSHESSKVLTDIDNLLKEPSNGSDVSDTDEQKMKRAEGEKVSGAPKEATESLEVKNAVAGRSGVKRKADDDLGDHKSTGPDAKTSKLDSDDGVKKEDGDEVDDRLLDELDNDNVSFDQMADLLDQKDQEESREKEGAETPEITMNQISKRLRELKIKYKNVLQKVFTIYGLKRPTWSFDPIVHQDPDDETKILGIEELQEYVDNQHPMWRKDMNAVAKMQNNQTTYVLSDFVHTRWGNQKIDPRSSLVVVEGCEEGEKKDDLDGNNANQNLQLKTENPPDMDLHKRAIKAIMEMDIEAISQEVLEKEKERRKLYQQKVYPLLSPSPDPSNLNNVISPSSKKLVPFDDFTEMINEKANWSNRTKDEVIAGTEEAVQMGSNYTWWDRRLSEDQVETILDMEEAVDKILEIDKKAEDENRNTRDFMSKNFMSKKFLENA